MSDRLEIVSGLAMPFFPMRPTLARSITDAEAFYRSFRQDEWIMQPKLAGDRACLAVVNKRVFIQNRHGGWYRPGVQVQDFLKVPDRTVFDGEVFKGEFHPFEVLAVNGKSFLRCTASEREVVAYQLVKLIGHAWMFEHPTKHWLADGKKNLPAWDGVVLKRANSIYSVLGSDSQSSGDWLKCLWKKT